jgi:tRNA pseudouridine38-40 synthase
MIRVALKIAYLGTDFYGFQRQPNLRTVEGELLSALEEAGAIKNFGQSNYSLAGRTDRGVHALGNVVSFNTENDPIINQINDLLPQDIRILGSSRVSTGFKARFAYKRHYRYVLCRGVKDNWAVGKMQEAAHLMEGTHNYRNFSKRSERNPLRTVDSVQIKPHGRVYLVDVVGESFLWNMVRKMVAVLLSVGKGELEVEDVQRFLDPSQPAAITPLAPESLILMDVSYRGVEFKEDNYARSRFIQTLNKECFNHQKMVAATKEMILVLGRE